MIVSVLSKLSRVEMKYIHSLIDNLAWLGQKVDVC